MTTEHKNVHQTIVAEPKKREIMSLQTKIGRSVLDLGDIVKTSVISSLARAKSEGKFSVSDADLTVIANIVSAEIDAGMRNGADMVTRLVK